MVRALIPHPFFKKGGVGLGEIAQELSTIEMEFASRSDRRTAGWLNFPACTELQACAKMCASNPVW